MSTPGHTAPLALQYRNSMPFTLTAALDAVSAVYLKKRKPATPTGTDQLTRPRSSAVWFSTASADRKSSSSEARAYSEKPRFDAAVEVCQA